MRLTILLCVLIAITISSVMSSTYFFGEQNKETKLIYRDKVKYEAIPLKKRIKVFSYNGTWPIKAISCYDYQNSEASVNVTAGGVGYKYVELRLKSQRSYSPLTMNSALDELLKRDSLRCGSETRLRAV